MTVRQRTTPLGWAIGTARLIIKPAMLALTKRDWIDGTKIPADGGCLVVVNHLSYADPLVTAYFFYEHGRVPRYLAKAGLWRNKFLRPLLDNAQQIPVERLTSTAVGAFDAGVAAVQRGELVVVYPEGTITRDPELWPMVGKSGAARIALATQCPVIPLGQWGVQELMPAYRGKLKISLKRPMVHLKVGEPIDLSDLYGQEVTTEVIAQATDRIMAAVTEIVEELRDDTAPAQRFDPRAAGVREIGNPNQAEPKIENQDQQQEGDA